MKETGVVVTGGASGIGRACAVALAEAGRPVAVWDLAEADVGDVSIQVDVADGEAVSAAAERTRQALPSIGGFVHAAGIVSIEPLGSIDFTNFQQVLDVNLVAYARITQELLPDLRAVGAGAAIVGVASIDGLVGGPVVPAYCASKAGVLGLTRSMAADLGASGIRVNAVCPGYIDTPMLEMALSIPGVGDKFAGAAPLGRIGQPEDIARVVRFLLSEESSFVTGQAFVADGGVIAVDPMQSSAPPS